MVDRELALDVADVRRSPVDDGETELSVLQLLFGFSGRIGRRAYFLPAILAAIVAGIYISLVFTPMALLKTDAIPRTPSTVLISIPVWPIIWMQLALLAKRSHDLGFSMWWYLGVSIAQTVAFRTFVVVSRAANEQQNPQAALFALVLYAAAIILLLWLLWITIKLVFFKGQPHPNAYGARTLGVRWDW